MTTDLTSGRWTLDASSSSVGLRHKTFWGLMGVAGSFGTVHGTGDLSADGTVGGRLVVDVASLDTKHAKRDKHLLSKDFFEVESHPEIVFEATSVRPSADGTALVEGDLTVRGRTRKLSFPVSYQAEGADAVVLKGTVEIDRTDYGLTWNQLGMLKGPAGIDLTLRFTATA
jgi:polyisoprenoid-binding protein YceI